MFKALIFGGTTEGRRLAEFCEENGIHADISVTTEYGAELLSSSEFIKILTGRLDENGIKSLLEREKYSVVIDATHPYAVEASANIKAACGECETEYYRLLRKSSKLYGTVVDSVSAAIGYLNKSDKKALLTTGSKTLAEFTAVKDHKNRLTARVLPADGIAGYCAEIGFENTIIQSGPFSVEQNIEHIKKSGAEILVTKESGAAGGYPEKAKAARMCGIELVTIRRPTEKGLSEEKIFEILLKKSVNK